MNWEAVWDNRDLLMAGLRVTVIASVVTVTLSILIGLTVVLARLSPSRSLRAIARLYVDALQNTPYLIVVFFVFFGLPEVGVTLSPLHCGIVGLSAYSGAFFAEAFRAGASAVDWGQWEAFRASGMGYVTGLRFVILPQALVYALPATTFQIVRAIKNTSVLSLVAGGDLLAAANQAVSTTFVVFPFYFFVAAVFLAMIIPLTRISEAIERRVSWRREVGRVPTLLEKSDGIGSSAT